MCKELNNRILLGIVDYLYNLKNYSDITVYGKKSFLSKVSDTKILQSIYFTYKVGIISSYSNRIYSDIITSST